MQFYLSVRELNVYGNIHIENDKRRFVYLLMETLFQITIFCYKEYVEENNNYLYRNKKNKEAKASLFFLFLLPITLSIKPKA